MGFGFLPSNVGFSGFGPARVNKLCRIVGSSESCSGWAGEISISELELEEEFFGLLGVFDSSHSSSFRTGSITVVAP